VAAQVLSLSRLPGISVDGVMTHLSDADLSDPVAAGEQIRRFRSLQTALTGAGLKIPCLHMANSAAVLALPEAHFDAVRPGLLLYGCWPLEEAERPSRGANASFEPVMTVKARILSLRRMPAGSAISYGGTFKTKRDSLIAVISVGYADGYSRAFSNRAQVIAGGTRAPVVGRVCMDLTMIDVTGIEGLSEGDEVVLLGRQGEETITASELSSHAGTIPYEILTSLGGRARRKLYVDQVP
jgi:alanine racemase